MDRGLSFCMVSHCLVFRFSCIHYADSGISDADKSDWADELNRSALESGLKSKKPVNSADYWTLLAGNFNEYYNKAPNL